MTDNVKGELQQLWNDGVLQVADIHDWAEKHPESSLHKQIGVYWDDDKAGREYRLNIIRRLIVIHTRDVTQEPTVISLSVDRYNGTGGGYRRLPDVIKDSYYLDVAINDCLQRLETVYRKYCHICDLAGLEQQIKVLKAKVEQKPAKKRRGPGPKEDRVSA